MKTKRPLTRVATLVLLLALPTFLFADYLWAHCDGLDGPVVRAAERALASGNANFALVWVRPEDEPEIRSVFRQALAVRTGGPEARALADRHFFETLVRLHRASEGAPYTGLAPAGRDLGPAIPAADLAVETGDVQQLEALLTEAVRDGLRAHFEAARRTRSYDVDDVARGREHVRAYVELVAWVERIHEAATAAAEGHYAEPKASH